MLFEQLETTLTDAREPERRLSRKEAGAYYTPDAVVATLVRWAVREPTDRLLDPSCGDAASWRSTATASASNKTPRWPS
jgi:type I restriction-modification system DNA methylase subunit